MIIILSCYALLVWLVFFQLRLLAWNRTAHVFVGLIGLGIALIVVGLLNTKTPSGRVTVMGIVVEVAPTVGGVVAEIPVSVNVPIERGDVLFRLDARPYRYALDDAQAALEIAKITYERKKAVIDGGSESVSLQSLDESKAQYDKATAQLKSAQFDFEQTVIRAAGSGIVTSMALSVGDQARPLSPVMPFIRTDSLFLLGVFEQNGSAALTEGAPVEIAFDIIPGKIFESNIEAVLPGTSSGQIDVSSDIVGSSDIGSKSEALVRLTWPEGLPHDGAKLGTVGTATAFGSDAGAMGILARVLLYVRALGTFL